MDNSLIFIEKIQKKPPKGFEPLTFCFRGYVFPSTFFLENRVLSLPNVLSWVTKTFSGMVYKADALPFLARVSFVLENRVLRDLEESLILQEIQCPFSL